MLYKALDARRGARAIRSAGAGPIDAFAGMGADLNVRLMGARLLKRRAGGKAALVTASRACAKMAGMVAIAAAFGFMPGDGARAQVANANASAAALPKFYSLKSNPVNLRKGPGTQFPKAWIYRREGLPVEVLREHERWRQVRDSDGATGWILRTLISQRRTALVAPWLLKERSSGTQAPSAATAGADKLVAMLSGPRRRANVLARLEAGALVNLKTCDGTWCHVSIGRFRGYVEQKQLWGIYPSEVLR